MAKKFKTVIDKFYGLNECTRGEGGVKSGESPMMKNLTVTQDYSLILRNGWEAIHDGEGVGRGLLAGDYRIWVVSEHVYTDKGGAVTEIGELESSQGDVTIFPYGGKHYFLDGVKVKVYDGESFGDIEPYIPTVAVGCNYQGAGTPFEEANMLSPYRRQSFTGDGEHLTWKLAESNIERVESVILDGERIYSSRYSVNTEGGTVTFDNIPYGTTPDNLVITYKMPDDLSENINRMRYASVYGENDTRVFLWGDGEYPARVRYCGVFNGMSGMEYFPELYFNDIPTGDKVTSVTAYFDTLLIFGQNSLWKCHTERTVDSYGNDRTLFPMKNVSSDIGCSAENFVKKIDNTPVSLSLSGLYRWQGVTIRDELNYREIGVRIRNGLKGLGVTGVKSFDRTSHSELYIWRGESVYVYNYALDLYYYYEGFNAHDFACDSTGLTWFLSTDGRLCRFIDEKSDGGEDIAFMWQSGYEEIAGLDTKNIHRLEFEILPSDAVDFKFEWFSGSRGGRGEVLTASWRVADFRNVYFDEFSFSTATSPIRLYKRVKLKRIRGFKVIVTENGSCRDFHMMSFRVKGTLTDTL